MSFSFRRMLAIKPDAWLNSWPIDFPTGVGSDRHFTGLYCSCYFNPIKCVLRKVFSCMFTQNFLAPENNFQFKTGQLNSSYSYIFCRY